MIENFSKKIWEKLENEWFLLTNPSYGRIYNLCEQFKPIIKINLDIKTQKN